MKTINFLSEAWREIHPVAKALTIAIVCVVLLASFAYGIPKDY